MKRFISPISQMVLCDLRLSYRVRIAFFFSYIFPLITFFLYTFVFGRGNPQSIPRLLGPLLTLILVSNALFGVSNLLATSRESGALRVYYLHPVRPVQILLGKAITSTALFLPVTGLILLLTRWIYGLHLAASWPVILLFLLVATFFICSLGLMVASLVESSAAAQVVNQILFMVLIFLSGTTISMESMPDAMRILANFVPTTHLVRMLGAMIAQPRPDTQAWSVVLLLSLTATLWILLCTRLFRWDTGYRLSPKAHLLAAATCLPLFFYGLVKALLGSY